MSRSDPRQIRCADEGCRAATEAQLTSLAAQVSDLSAQVREYRALLERFEAPDRGPECERCDDTGEVCSRCDTMCGDAHPADPMGPCPACNSRCSACGSAAGHDEDCELAGRGAP